MELSSVITFAHKFPTEHCWNRMYGSIKMFQPCNNDPTMKKVAILPPAMRLHHSRRGRLFAFYLIMVWHVTYRSKFHFHTTGDANSKSNVIIANTITQCRWRHHKKLCSSENLLPNEVVVKITMNCRKVWGVNKKEL